MRLKCTTFILIITHAPGGAHKVIFESNKKYQYKVLIWYSCSETKTELSDRQHEKTVYLHTHSPHPHPTPHTHTHTQSLLGGYKNDYPWVFIRDFHY